MTLAQWLASTDPMALLTWHQSPQVEAWRISDRKLRLFACACCLQIEPDFLDERSRWAVTVAEHFADTDARQGRRHVK